MKKLLTATMGGAIGYVLGARAGRERYEEMKGTALRLGRERLRRRGQAGDSVDLTEVVEARDLTEVFEARAADRGVGTPSL